MGQYCNRHWCTWCARAFLALVNSGIAHIVIDLSSKLWPYCCTSHTFLFSVQFLRKKKKVNGTELFVIQFPVVHVYANCFSGGMVILTR